VEKISDDLSIIYAKNDRSFEPSVKELVNPDIGDRMG